MSEAISTIRFLWLAWRTYRSMRSSGNPQYAAMCYRGVPQVCVFIGAGRQAWRISQLAVEGWEPVTDKKAIRQ